MKTQLRKTLLLLAMGVGTTQGVLHANNTFFSNGDLVLFLQKPGSNNTVTVSLGSAALDFRGSSSGPVADRQNINIINIDTELTNAFGAGWASDVDVFAGLIACRSSSENTSNITNGDMNRTLYASQARPAVGTSGTANSGAWDLSSNPFNQGSTFILAYTKLFNDNTTTQAAVTDISVTRVRDYNPFLNEGLRIQGQSYAAFNGGIQQRGSDVTFDAFGPVASPEFMLDLYRILPDNSANMDLIPGPYRSGSYEGTVTIDSAGNVSFITQGAPSIPPFVDSSGDGMSDFLKEQLSDFGFIVGTSQPELVAEFLASQNLFTENSIQDLVTAGQVMIQAVGNDVNLALPIFKSEDLNTFIPAGDLELTIPKEGDKQFYRIQLGE